MSWIRIRICISPYGSRYDFYYTNPDPWIPIRITAIIFWKFEYLFKILRVCWCWVVVAWLPDCGMKLSPFSSDAALSAPPPPTHPQTKIIPLHFQPIFSRYPANLCLFLDVMCVFVSISNVSLSVCHMCLCLCVISLSECHICLCLYGICVSVCMSCVSLSVCQVFLCLCVMLCVYLSGYHVCLCLCVMCVSVCI